jgi:hypothetical protein
MACFGRIEGLKTLLDTHGVTTWDKNDNFFMVTFAGSSHVVIKTDWTMLFPISLFCNIHQKHELIFHVHVFRSKFCKRVDKCGNELKHAISIYMNIGRFGLHLFQPLISKRIFEILLIRSKIGLNGCILNLKVNVHFKCFSKRKTWVAVAGSLNSTLVLRLPNNGSVTHTIKR